MTSSTGALSEEIGRAIQTLDVERTRQRYWDQDECVFLERFLPPETVAGYLLPAVDSLRAVVHRSYLPRHKKGGAVSYFALAEKAPVFLTLYRSPAFIDFLSRLVGARVMPCPDGDPHACAGEERIVLSMEYVTKPAMGPFKRVVSTMKDAVAYFGFAAVLGKGRRRR